ncbi:unnamed protein product, partial [Meganyctiphanes norvegica]
QKYHLYHKVTIIKKKVIISAKIKFLTRTPPKKSQVLDLQETIVNDPKAPANSNLISENVQSKSKHYSCIYCNPITATSYYCRIIISLFFFSINGKHISENVQSKSKHYSCIYCNPITATSYYCRIIISLFFFSTNGKHV